MNPVVSPVCPVTDMAASLRFWKQLGFDLDFSDDPDPLSASYTGVKRGGLELHLQFFTAEQMEFTQTMATRIRMESRDALEALYAEWEPHGFITAPLEAKPWGNYEFGFYDPNNTPFYFYVNI